MTFLFFLNKLMLSRKLDRNIIIIADTAGLRPAQVSMPWLTEDQDIVCLDYPPHT